MPIYCQSCREFIDNEDSAYQVAVSDDSGDVLGVDSYAYYHLEHCPEGALIANVVHPSDILKGRIKPTGDQRLLWLEEVMAERGEIAERKAYKEQRRISFKKKRKEMAERNKGVISDRESGMLGSQVALKYGISKTRVYDIYMKAKRSGLKNDRLKVR